MPTTPLPESLSHELARLVQRTLGAALRDASDGGAELAPLHVPPSDKPRGPAALAQAQGGSPNARAQSLALYLRCLAHYRSAVQARLRPGLGQDDLGTAAAYFVLANMAAVAGTRPDPATLPPVERQLRWLLGRTDAWRSGDIAQRQTLFEQLALLGVLVNESRIAADRQGAAAQANLQNAARGYLKQLLGFDADLLSVSVQGLAAGADTLH